MVPIGYWEKPINQKCFFDWSGTELGHRKMEDWYNITQEDIRTHGGRGLLNNLFSGSHSAALQSAYPEHNWILWKFSVTQQGFWKKKENQKIFFNWLGSQLGHKSMDDWYNVTQKDIRNNGGGGLLGSYYRGSPSSAVQSVYPEHNWMLWRFNTVPRGCWERLATDPNEAARMIQWLGEQLSIKCLDD